MSNSVPCSFTHFSNHSIFSGRGVQGLWDQSQKGGKYTQKYAGVPAAAKALFSLEVRSGNSVGKA